MMSYTIYFIENEVNHKGYVGMTCKSPEQRFKEHLQAARRGIDYALHRAIRKYGEENFHIFPIDEASSEEQAFELEQEWIERLGTYEFEYNLTPGGDGFGGGVDSPSSLLIEEDVREIRKTYVEDEKPTTYTLASKYGIGRATITKVLKGESYSSLCEQDDLQSEIDEKLGTGHSRNRAKLTDQQVEEMRRRYVEDPDTTTNHLAEEHGLHSKTVGPILRGERADYPTPDEDTLEKVNDKIQSYPDNRGSRCGASKLQEEDVRQLRERYVDEEHLSAGDLAEQYSITRSTVTSILRGETWAQVPMPDGVEEARSRKKRGITAKSEAIGVFTKKEVREMRRLYDETGLYQRQIAEQFDTGQDQVSRIVRGETYPNAGGPIKS